MPTIPIKHSESRIISRREADNVSCEGLYDAAAKRLGTYNLNVTITPGRTAENGKFIPGPSVRVPPLSAQKLALYILPQYDEARIEIEYTLGVNTYDPDKKMTRREFVMETLDVWDRMLSKLSENNGDERKAAMVIIGAMETLKGTYTIGELLDTLPTLNGGSKIDMGQFREYFDPTNKEDSAHAV